MKKVISILFFMTSKTSQLTVILKLLYFITKELQKNKYKTNQSNIDLKDFRFKLLYLSEENDYDYNNLIKDLNNTISTKVNYDLLIKMIYFVNFKDTLDPNQFNRLIINNYKNMHQGSERLLDYEIQENALLQNKSYRETVIINTLYTLYNIKHLLHVAKTSHKSKTESLPI